MRMELTLNGDLQLNMNTDEGNILYSFLSYFTRKKDNAVTKEEYDLVASIKEDMNVYLNDELSHEEVDECRQLLAEYKYLKG